MDDGNKSAKCVRRIDDEQKKTFGWLVRVRFENTVHSKFFSDSKFNGSTKAFKEAVAYRDQLEQKIGKPRTDRRVKTKSAANQTGVLGVQLIRRLYKGQERVYYEASISLEPNVLHKKTFPIKDGNVNEAFERAVAYRLKMEKRVYGRALQTWPSSSGTS